LCDGSPTALGCASLVEDDGTIENAVWEADMLRYEKFPAIYILASRRNGTLYIGVTSDLINRISIHKQDIVEGFTKRYGVHLRVYYEYFDTMEEAIRREKQLKKWRRRDKVALIEKHNPGWRDLYTEVSGLVDPNSIPKLV